MRVYVTNETSGKSWKCGNWIERNKPHLFNLECTFFSPWCVCVFSFMFKCTNVIMISAVRNDLNLVYNQFNITVWLQVEHLKQFRRHDRRLPMIFDTQTQFLNELRAKRKRNETRRKKTTMKNDKTNYKFDDIRSSRMNATGVGN